MATTQPVRLIEIGGPPYEQGRQHGQQAAAEIRKGISHYATQVRRLKLSDADLAQIVRRYLPTIEAFEPRYVEEMRGIAQGAGVEFDHVVMLNARTEVLKLASGAEKFGHDPAVGHDPDPDGCTTIVVEPEAAAEGRLIHAHNWDWKLESAEASIILRIIGTDGPDILTFTEAGALGRFGFNSAGIAITANYLESNRDYTQLGVPLALIRRKVLEESRFAMALRHVYATAKSASNNIALSHSGVGHSGGGHSNAGMVFDFECAPDEAFEVEPREGVLVHANHWRSPVALAKLRDKGIATTPDSLYRERRVRKLLARKTGGLGVADVKAALLDDWETPWAICRPPRPSAMNDLSATVCTLVMQPSLGLMEVAMLPALGASFVEYTLRADGVAAAIGSRTGS